MGLLVCLFHSLSLSHPYTYTHTHAHKHTNTYTYTHTHTYIHTLKLSPTHIHTHSLSLTLSLCMLLLRKSQSLLSQNTFIFQDPCVNFINILSAAFTLVGPKSKKMTLVTWLSFLPIWDLLAQNLLLKCWWNRLQLCTMYNVVVHVCFAITQPLKSFFFKKSQKYEIATLKGSMARTICSFYLLFLLNLLSF